MGGFISFYRKNDNGVAIIDSSSLLGTHEKRAKMMKYIHTVGAKCLFIEVSQKGDDIYIPFDSPDYEGMCLCVYVSILLCLLIINNRNILITLLSLTLFH